MKQFEPSERDLVETGALLESDASESKLKVPEYSASELYLNRELSWLQFNWRVLNEADDPRTPLLERVKFLAIVSSNIDEFCMKRIGGLRLQIDAGAATPSVDGRTPEQQVLQCGEQIKKLGDAKDKIYGTLLSELADNNIHLRKYHHLNDQDKAHLRAYYLAEVLPLLTPQAIDVSHPFPFISNQSLNLFVSLRDGGGRDPVLARIKVPVGPDVPRFVKLPRQHSSVRNEYVLLDDIMMQNLDVLFPDMEVESCDVFRITRNANTVADHADAGDLVEMILAHLHERKFAPIVRIQFARTIGSVSKFRLFNNLNIDPDYCMLTTDALIGMSDLMEIASLDIPALHDPLHVPSDNARLKRDDNIFDQIAARGPVLLQHPYESFETSVERFVREASRDRKVRAIKMTIYRTSTDTRLVDYLVDAARNGKQVAVVVELTASFDEQANIAWAQRLEEAGIHVSYGILGLKTHSKVILVVRKEQKRFTRYAHVGTGNYHAGTAKLYSDVGMLTCDDELTNDLSELFNYLTTGCAPVRAYRKLLTAPLLIKKRLIENIDREISHAADGRKARIRLKTNALEDVDIVSALYKASQAGVAVELIIRDICRLRPGLENLSDNIKVVSIVGRFLEHARIYHFHNDGEDDYYTGSADLMKRNLEQRIEILVPVLEPDLQSELDWILQSQLGDQRSGWAMGSDGSYLHKSGPEQKSSPGSQQQAILRAKPTIFQVIGSKAKSVLRRGEHHV